jgi:hypothetical protein
MKEKNLLFFVSVCCPGYGGNCAPIDHLFFDFDYKHYNFQLSTFNAITPQLSTITKIEEYLLFEGLDAVIDVIVLSYHCLVFDINWVVISVGSL